MTDRRFKFAPLREADLPMLLEWLNRPHLLESWGGGGPGEIVTPDGPALLMRISRADWEAQAAAGGFGSG